MTPLANLLLAFSNLAVVPASVLLFQYRQWLDLIVFSLAAAASFAYHLVERKHTLPGAIHTPHWRWWLNLDRFAAFLAVGCVALRHWNVVCEEFPISLTAIIAGFLSELLGRQGHITLFVVTHAIWHIQAFRLVYYVALQAAQVESCKPHPFSVFLT